MEASKVLLSIFIMAIVTYFIRFIPLALVREKIESQFIKSFLYYIPFAVLGAMTFPSILYSTGNMIFSAMGTLVALGLAYFERGLLTVTIGAISTVFVLNIIF